MPATAVGALPTVSRQADRLIELGVHQIVGISADELHACAGKFTGDNGLLVLHPDRAPASRLAPIIPYNGKNGFVVTDMRDVDDFRPIASATPPEGLLYVLTGVERGDQMANWSPDEALPEILAAGRTPLTLSEGIHWLLQQPDAVQRGHCFMTIASRLRKPDGTLDSRTPALWISNGTGRDGPENRNALKVGWCWAGNRHTWLGFASATARRAIPLP